MKIIKGISTGFLLLILMSIEVIIISLIMNIVKTNNLKDDYSEIYKNENVMIENVELKTQEISCGYAVIEMFAKWIGENNITEKSLYATYGKIVTSTGDSFQKEMNKQFKEYKTTIYKYLKNSELLKKVYDSLKNNIPVPFEWAAKYNEEWTLHYSLIYGMDLKKDLIYILNPYGYKEELNFKDFLNRTNFRAFEKMPFYFDLAFAFNIFEKNTIFIVEKI